MMNRNYTHNLVILAPPIIFLIFQLIYPINTEITQPDSGGYINFSALRTPGYPYFIKLSEIITGSIEGVIYLQLMFFTFSALYVSLSIYSATRSLIFTSAIVTAILINPELNKYHYIILTESLFVSITILICAELIRLARSFSLLRFFTVGLLIGLSISIRPIGYAFVPLLPILFLVFWSKMRSQFRIFRTIIITIIPLLSILFLDTWIYSIHHGLPKKSVLAITAYGKAGLVSTDGINPYTINDPYFHVWQELEDEVKSTRVLIRNAPDFPVKNFLIKSYEVFLEFQFGNETITKAATKIKISRLDVMKEVAFTRIIGNPIEYFELSFNHYFGLWTIYGATHPNTVGQLKNYIKENKPLPFSAANGYVTDDISPQSIALLLQPVFQIFGLLTFLAVCLFGLSLVTSTTKPSLLIAGISALMVHGNYLLVALTGIGIMRYTLAMWPGIIISVGFLLWSAIEYEFLPTPEKLLQTVKHKLISRP